MNEALINYMRRYMRRTLALLKREREAIEAFNAPLLLPACLCSEHKYCRGQIRRDRRTQICACGCHTSKGESMFNKKLKLTTPNGPRDLEQPSIANAPHGQGSQIGYGWWGTEAAAADLLTLTVRTKVR